MGENGHITPREFEREVTRIEGRIDSLEDKVDNTNGNVIKLQTEFSELKQHFNHKLKVTIDKKIQYNGMKLSLRNGLILVIAGSVATLILAKVFGV